MAFEPIEGALPMLQVSHVVEYLDGRRVFNPKGSWGPGL